MTGGNLPFLHHLQHRLRQIEQTQCIGNRRSGFSDPFGYLLLCHVVPLHQQLVPAGFLDCVEVLPLQVFNQRNLHRLFFIHLTDDDRNLLQARHPAGSPASFSCYQLIDAARQRTDQQRLQYAVLTDGICQFVERFLIEHLTRLLSVWLDLAQAQCHHPGIVGVVIHK